MEEGAEEVRRKDEKKMDQDEGNQIHLRLVKAILPIDSRVLRKVINLGNYLLLGFLEVEMELKMEMETGMGEGEGGNGEGERGKGRGKRGGWGVIRQCKRNCSGERLSYVITYQPSFS